MISFWQLVLAVAGLIASAFFSGVETGLISLNRVRLRHEVERRSRRAQILDGFLNSTERLLATTLIGTNLANTVVAIALSTLAIRLLADESLGELVATIAATGLVLVFGEIVPKNLFRRYPHRLCTTCADLLNGAAWLFAPLVLVLSALMRGLARLTGQHAERPRSFFVTREELKYLAREGEAGGALTPEERQMIHGVFDFPHKTAYDVMVPLAHTVTVGRETTVSELYRISQRTGFARFPVRENNQMVGTVNVYEILFAGDVAATATVADHLRPPQFVLATDRIDHVLPQMRASRNPINLVINPEGRPLGIVTIEDIVEEIVGDVEG